MAVSSTLDRATSTGPAEVPRLVGYTAALLEGSLSCCRSGRWDRRLACPQELSLETAAQAVAAQAYELHKAVKGAPS